MSGRPNPRSRHAATALLAGLALAAGCAPPPEPPPGTIVLITIDTLRADHVGSYGYPLSTTPFFDSLAASGTVFTRAYAHSATTKPSHSSMFTALYPTQHAVRNNGLVLDEEFDTLAELLSEAGYTTAAFVSTDAPLGGQVNQGFGVWDQFVADRDREGGRKEYRAAADTIDTALAWLESTPPEQLERLFLWIHVYDPHKPLQPPENELFEIEREIAGFGEQEYVDLHLARGIPYNDRSREDLALYDAEILYADRQLQRVHEAMSASGRLDDSLWVVTSDHGQGLGAHDWFGHSKQIYNAQLWVPLLFWSPGQEAAVRIEDQVVEHVDLMPTIAEVVGVQPRQIMSIQGQSLVPYLNGTRPRQPKWFAFGERSYYENASRRRQQRGNYEPGSRFSLQDLEFKYLLYTDGEDEFYTLEDDPYELVNRIDDPAWAERRDQMRDALTQLLQAMPVTRQAASVSEADMERLRSLGYIQ